MAAARVLSFGSLPPEMGGAVHGGVATFHGSLISDPDSGVVAVVAPAHDPARVPVPAFSPSRGEKNRRFLTDVVDRVRPHAALNSGMRGAWPALLANIAPTLPRIGIAHSWHALTLADEDQRPAMHEAIQSALDGLSALVLGSRHCLEEGLALGFRFPQRVEMIHYPLRPEYAAPIDLFAPRDGVVYLGTLQPRKRPDLLVAAAAHLPDVSVTFVGAGAEEAALRMQIDESGVGSRVRIEPREATQSARARLARAEVMCLPSRSETFGLVYIEALACGTPVVGFKPMVDEIQAAVGVPIGEGIDSDDPRELAESIQRVRDAEWDRRELRESVLRTFGLNRAARHYGRLCTELAEAGRHTPLWMPDP